MKTTEIKSLLKENGVKTLRCRVMDNKLFVTVDSVNKEKAESLLYSIGLINRGCGYIIANTFANRTSFDNLIFKP